MKAVTYRRKNEVKKSQPGKRLAAWLALGLIFSMIFLSGCKAAETPAAPPAAGSSPQATGTVNAFEKLIPAAQAFVDMMNQGNFAAAVQPFDATMIKAMPEAKLKDTWQQLLGQVGAFKSQLGTRTETSQGYRIVFVTCEFENSIIDVQVVYNAQDQISGLFFKPGQRPSGTAEPQSSSSVLTLTAEDLIDQLAQGNYAAAMVNFNAEMKAVRD